MDQNWLPCGRPAPCSTRVDCAHLIVDSTEQRHQSRLNVDYVAAAAAAGCMRRTSLSAGGAAAWQRDKTLVADIHLRAYVYTAQLVYTSVTVLSRHHRFGGNSIGGICWGSGATPPAGVRAEHLVRGKADSFLLLHK